MTNHYIAVSNLMTLARKLGRKYNLATSTYILRYAYGYDVATDKYLPGIRHPNRYMNGGCAESIIIEGIIRKSLDIMNPTLRIIHTNNMLSKYFRMWNL